MCTAEGTFFMSDELLALMLNKVEVILKEIKEMVMGKKAKHKALFDSIYLSSALVVASRMET